MTKTVIICDFCKREIINEERYDIDAKIRHIKPTDKRKGFVRGDMCKTCFGKLVSMCQQNEPCT